VGPHLLISEIRSIAADNLWMSPCYRQPCVTLHFTWKPDWPAVRRLLPIIEKELAPFQARPHWGKLFLAGEGEIAPLYERLGDFGVLLDRVDPRGAFRNDWLTRHVLGG